MGLINEKNLNLVRNKLNRFSEKGKKIVMQAREGEFNRKILEDKRVDVLVFPAEGEKKDVLKQRDSGLNHVLCKIAKQNNVEIGIDIEKLLKSNLSQELPRIIQNIKFCKKYKIKIILINIRKKNKHDLKSFLLTLGMKNDDVKYAVEKSFDI